MNSKDNNNRNFYLQYIVLETKTKQRRTLEEYWFAFSFFLEKINSENIENKIKTLFRINLQISNFKKENSKLLYLVFLPDL